MTPLAAPTALRPGAAPVDRQSRSAAPAGWETARHGVAPRDADAEFAALRSRRAAGRRLRRAGAYALPAEPGVWDELRGADGSPRPHWRRSRTCCRRRRPADRPQTRRAWPRSRADPADGVTYNVYADAGRGDRPWELDLLPLIIAPAEWAAIEAGVAQRAALLDAVLADLYGPRRLLCEGLIPPALLFRHPGFLRPLIGIEPPGGLHLHIAAADLARAPDGRWWVLATAPRRRPARATRWRTGSSSRACSRRLPRAPRPAHRAASAACATRSCGVRRADGATPRVVLLTPGPYNETYFEHAYLARYLGLPLVEGGDLTVRDERL